MGISIQSVTDKVYEILRDEILQNQLRTDNSRLSVQVLAERLGVSRTPVQQALYRLADAGLVVIRPRSGTYVSPVNLDDVQSTIDIRRALECLAVESAVAVYDEPLEAKLSELVTRIAELRMREQTRDAEEANYRFHHELILAAGNERLTRIYETLNLYLTMCRIHHRTDGWKRRIGQEEGEHRAIIAAFRARDIAKAKEAVERHLLRSKTSLAKEFAPHQCVTARPPEGK